MKARTAMAMLVVVIGSTPALPASALPYEPGEELELSVHFLGLHAGDLKVQVGLARANGAPLWPVTMRARTRGLVGMMYGFDEKVTSVLDPATGASEGYDLVADLDGKPREEHVRYQGPVALVHAIDRKGTKDARRKILPGAMDALAAVFRLRAMPLSAKAATIPIFTGQKSWPLEVRVIGRERVATDAGAFDTLVVRCRTHFDGKFSSQRELTVWLTDDARRLPVRLEADFMIGSMNASLVRFREGAVAENDARR